ncbi:MAG: sigma-70 family RNA polymerase sigma factor [Verrucomicrobiota bacterium]
MVEDVFLSWPWKQSAEGNIVRQGALPDTPAIPELTARMARGEDAAYRHFHQLYFDRLHRYLLVVMAGNEAAARDALQQTYLRVVRHVREFPSADVFWSWLAVLARSSARDESRRQRRYLAALDRFFQRRVDNGIPDVDADARLMELLEAALAGLPAEERELLEQKYYHRASVEEIALRSQTTLKAVESRLVRTRRKLREAILSALKHER